MSFSKNISSCRHRCVLHVSTRTFNSGGSNAVGSEKMQTKNIVLNQWRLIAELKTYISKLSNDKTFENALNKEFAQFLQKIQPKVYGTELVRFFESAVALPLSQPKKEVTQGLLEKASNSLPTIFGALKITVGKQSKPNENCLPKWKMLHRTVSKESIKSRTSQIINGIVCAETDKSKCSRIEELIDHLKQYPEAKHNAVKDGTVPVLLRVRQVNRNENILESLNEAFALLGYTDPVSGNGVRILSIDGGGVRGILVVEMLRKLEELSGKPIHELFDIICGVSTGAILATLVGLRQKSLDEVSDIYKNLSTQIFTQSTLRGTSSLVWSHSYYDTAKWEELLRKEWGETTLTETCRNSRVPKFCAISTVVNHSRLSAYVFRNYSLPCRVQSQYLGGCQHKVWEAVRASAAAPTYFEEFKLANMLHQDGGVLINNPTAVALHEAKLLWPSTPVQCIVSCGTGRTVPSPLDFDATMTVSNSSWKKKFFAILDSATDTEGVHTILSDLLPDNVYYRFNPYLTEMLDIAEINPDKLEQLKRDALMYLRGNEDKFQEAVKVLNVKKSTVQKSLDWISLQKQMYSHSLL